MELFPDPHRILRAAHGDLSPPPAVAICRATVAGVSCFCLNFGREPPAAGRPATIVQDAKRLDTHQQPAGAGRLLPAGDEPGTAAADCPRHRGGSRHAVLRVQKAAHPADQEHHQPHQIHVGRPSFQRPRDDGHLPPGAACGALPAHAAGIQAEGRPPRPRDDTHRGLPGGGGRQIGDSVHLIPANHLRGARRAQEQTAARGLPDDENHRGVHGRDHVASTKT